MKKMFAAILVAILMFSFLPASLASPALPPQLLSSLTHNAPNTGKMLPERFDPYQNTYLLTVADWVSRITFTPVAAASTSMITVNGQPVMSGQKSQIIQMTNDPQMVQIVVTAYGEGNIISAQNTYTIYLQRRPSERRTRVSAGFLTNVEVADGIATISADLVTINYQPKTNISSYTNETVYLYKHKTSENCLFYYGTKNSPIRAANAQEFLDNYLSYGDNLFYLVYIEDEIVTVLPYAADI